MKKYQLPFTDFRFISRTLGLNKENKTVAEVGADKPSEDEKLSIANMELNDQNKWTDVDEDGNIVWTVGTEYRDTDSWSESQFGMIAQE